MKETFLKTAAKVVLPFFLVNVFAAYRIRTTIDAEAEKETITAPRHEIGFTLTDYDEPFDFHKSAQAAYLLESVRRLPSPKYNGNSELSRPNPARLKWTVECADELEFDEYSISLSRDAEMSDAKEYVTSEPRLELYNLLLGETYYWSVSVTVDGERYTSETSTFEIAATAPRNLYIDGVTNVRDLGGWQTEGGGRVKQGMMYRTARLHTDERIEITEAGIAAMRELGVKTEIDLRYEMIGSTESALGEDVSYYLLPMEYDFTAETMFSQAEYIREFFRIASNEDNYPIFFHCLIGTDRTGLCAFLVNGLLGVAEEDLYRDYRFSNFGKIGGERDGESIERYIERLGEFEGATLSERIRSYLISIGVTESEIDSIVSIMSE